MPEEEPESTLPATDVIAAARAQVAEIEALLSTIKGRLPELESACLATTDAASKAQEKLTEITDAATKALAGRTQISDEQAVVVSKSAHIQDAQDHADKVRAELDKQLTLAVQQATEAEGLRTRAQAASDAADELLTTIRGTKSSADTDLAAVTAAKDAASGHVSTTKSLASKAASIEERIAAYEKSLGDLEIQSKAQLATITGLLPGATAAGLAHAFDQRRKAFLNPATGWQRVFVGSLVCLVLLALTGLWNVYFASSILSWDDLARLWVARLPIAAALVWLALHASRESALARRLEEDYGYKAAIAASFQGFQEQMAAIGGKASDGSPLSKLCEGTLATLADPPGRIYEKHHLVVTPGREIANAASNVVSRDKTKS